MNFHLPTCVWEEEHCVRSRAKELASLGSRALVVTGRRSSRANGSLDDVTRALKGQGIPCAIFDDVEENPSVETVVLAARQGIQEGADFVIGIGGGSPLDASKAIALLMANPDRGQEILYDSAPLSHLPVACVPTTAGTGSEVTPYAILTVRGIQTKRSLPHRIFPRLALLDPSYLKTMPRNTAASTAVDALAHLLESFLNVKSHFYSRIFCERGLSLFASVKDALAEDALDDEGLRALLRIAALGGMAISHTGTSLPHGQSYALTYHLGIPHGKAVGFFLGNFVERYPEKGLAREALSLLGFSDPDELLAYLDGLLRLSALNIPDDILETSRREVRENPGKLANYPLALDPGLSILEGT